MVSRAMLYTPSGLRAWALSKTRFMPKSGGGLRPERFEMPFRGEEGVERTAGMGDEGGVRRVREALLAIRTVVERIDQGRINETNILLSIVQVFQECYLLRWLNQLPTMEIKEVSDNMRNLQNCTVVRMALVAWKRASSISGYT